jgi:flagellar motility protein MotE (MotC chaperone)
MIKSKTKRRGGQKGSLVVIASLLIASAVLRIGEGAGQALARDPDAADPAGVGSGAAETACKTSEDMQAMLEAFNAREARIEEKEKTIRNRMHALQIADEQVTEKLAQLTDAETQLRETIAVAETAAEGDLDRLTRVYETMKPKQAAALFEEMDPNFAAGFLGRMRPEAAAAIMAGLSPEAAHLYSVVLAGRNANVPKE